MARNNESANGRFIRVAWELRNRKEFKGTEVESATLQVPQLARTNDPAEAVSRAFEACGFDVPTDAIQIDADVPPKVVWALIDAINGQGLALAKQKAAAERTKAKDSEGKELPFPTVEELQQIVDETVLRPVTRTRSGTSKRKIREERGKRVEEIVASGEANEEELAILRKFGLV